MSQENNVDDAAPFIDYSYFFMVAERAMKDTQEAMIHNDYDKALEFITLAQVELRLTYSAILHQKEQHNG